MKKADNNSLVKINKNKIKIFFINLFRKEKKVCTQKIEDANNVQVTNEKPIKNDTFMESLKKIENEETKILNLQKQYRSGKIEEKQLTPEQINSLIQLYDKQILQLKKSNEIRKQRLIQYRKA